MQSSTAAPEARVQLPSLQVLRGIAAMSVVVYHFRLFLEAKKSEPFGAFEYSITSLGASGVDLFFVLSGFIMVYTSTGKQGIQAAIHFLRRRVQRIVPLYWFWTTVMLLLYFSGLVLRHHHFSISFLLSSYLFVPAWDGEGYHPLLAPGWTLSFEMLFYIVFAICICFGLKRWRIPFLVAAFVVLGWAGHFLPLASGLRFLLENNQLAEFVYGVIAAELASRLSFRAVPARTAGLFLALGLAGFSLSLLPACVNQPNAIRWGIPALCIVLGCALYGAKARNRLLVFLGNASYSIYLTHYFFSLASGTILRDAPRYARFLPPELAMLIFSLAAISICCLSYLCVERPLMRFLHPGQRPRPVSDATSYPQKAGIASQEANL